VLPTIRSRTHNYTFRLVPSRTLQQHLAHICEMEGVAAEPAALTLVARAGAGSVRDSLSVLGQVISGSGPDGVTYTEAVAQLGMTDAALLDDTVDALANHDGALLFTVIDKVIDAGHDPRRFVTDLLERFRDLIVLHNVPNAAELGLIDAPEDQIAREVEQSQRFGLAELTRAAEVTSSALSELRGATAPRLHLELMAARLLLPASDADEAATRARLDQLERRIAAGPVHPTGASPGGAQSSSPSDAPAPRPSNDEAAPTAPTPPKRLSEVAPSSAAPASGTVRSRPPARPKARSADEPAAQSPADEPPAAPTPEPAPASGQPAASTVGLDQFVSLWPAVLEALKGYSRVAWMGFSASTPISMSNGELAVAVADAGTAKGVKASGHDERLRQAVLDVMRADVRIDVVIAPDRVGGSTPATSAARSAASAPEEPAPAADSDAPSMDDPTMDDSSGVDLALRELGATQIGEIEH
jgi:DNA polymerase-3 subunit gamma/tau